MPRRVLAWIVLVPLGGCASGLINQNDLALGPDTSEGPACAVRAMPELGGPPPVAGFGCATEVNLRDMLADPTDVERPEAVGAAKGDAAIDAARRHRMGQPRPLPSSSSPRGPAIVVNSGAQ